MTPAIATLLHRIIWLDNPHGITAEEIAEATETHVRSVYFYIEDERRPSAEWLRALSQYLVRAYGDTRIAQHFLPEGATITLAQGGETPMAVSNMEQMLLENIREGKAGRAASILETLITKPTRIQK